ncbi:MAG: hypothetical protein DWQ31_08185 [Planctomycetota bacterium]|nr:MAG: hypothetical protein DWQ31_08185 [Planctomycetota bacterium]REJ87972.1 MAG: hypothetical protein DWQ35_20640 [Planctomycetota bacterium]
MIIQSPSMQSPSSCPWFQYSIRSLLLLMLIGALVAWWFRPLPYPVDFKAVKYDINSETARFRVTNTAGESLWYSAYQPDEPFYSLEAEGQSLVSGNDFFGGCATGVEQFELAAGESMEFDITWLPELSGPAKKIRAGVRFLSRSQENGIWQVHMCWSNFLKVPVIDSQVAAR